MQAILQCQNECVLHQSDILREQVQSKNDDIGIEGQELELQNSVCQCLDMFAIEVLPG